VDVKRTIFLAVFLSVFAHGQQPNTSGQSPDGTRISQYALPVSRSDLYCAGFVSSQRLSRDHFVAGGLATPIQTHFGDRALIYLYGGGYAPGTRVAIVREMRDINLYTPFPEAQELLRRTGQVYGEMGYARVIEIRGHDVAVAQVELACQDMVSGDLAVPFVEKPALTYRKRSAMDLFPAASNAVTGRIVGARDFDHYLCAGSKVYLNLGNENGLKPGDYLRVVRGYTVESAKLQAKLKAAFPPVDITHGSDAPAMDPADAAVFNELDGDETQKNPGKLPKKSLGQLPRHVVGEAIVLSTQPRSATAMITFSLEDVHVGDAIELEAE
jgi:hypothetical protein